MITNGTVKASGAANVAIAALRKQRVGERIFVPSVRHLRFNLHSTLCQNRNAEAVCPQHGFHQNGQMYISHLKKSGTRSPHWQFLFLAFSSFSPTEQGEITKQVSFNPTSPNSTAHQSEREIHKL